MVVKSVHSIVILPLANTSFCLFWRNALTVQPILVVRITGHFLKFFLWVHLDTFKLVTAVGVWSMMKSHLNLGSPLPHLTSKSSILSFF